MSITPFDSFDDMMEQMRRDQDAADRRVQPWQSAIKPGDYFRRESGYGFPIYGEVLAEEEEREKALRHYRFCRCYSVACAGGELGDVHVSTIERLLRKPEFDAAHGRGWFP
ncbi:MAG: hypothetical protein SF069_11745 [Phycisphaerae bacterium]|nr:hypothetical protein [Phycisphaerae bacterium]